MIEAETLGILFEEATSAYSGNLMNSMTDDSASYTYGRFAERTREVSRLLSAHGIGAGGKVALFSAGHPNWAVVFFSAVAFGRVCVPILPDFSEREVDNVISHSGCEVIFVSRRNLPRISRESRESLKLIIELETLNPVYISDEAAHFDIRTAAPKADDVAVLIYTSGTSGKAKGVQLTHRNLLASVRSAYHAFVLRPKDVLLSVLPLAHAYELSVGFLYPFASGSGVWYLPKAPSTSVLLPAMRKVRPTAMLVVPLLMEKVYKGMVLPTIRDSKVLSWMDAHMHGLLCRLVGVKLMKAFGGRLKVLGIGGAKLDLNVEKFLYDARFPYYIGYGLTETSPLLTISCYRDTVPGSIGPAVYGVQLRLDNVNPETGEGEIVAKGDNVMPGYYLDPERTAGAFTDDGWFRTNDLASVDASGRYFIKGRLSNMILGASGENIYPEEIENVFRELPEVEEVIVVERKGLLVGLVCLVDGTVDFEHLDSLMIATQVDPLKEKILNYVNARVRSSSRLSSVELMTEPFEKTATLKIRRFLYNNSAPTV